MTIFDRHGFDFLIRPPGATEYFAELVDYDNGIMICARVRADDMRYKIMTGHVEEVRQLRDALNEVLK